MSNSQSAITIFIFLLIVSSAVVMITRWVRVPYTICLVIVGLLISPMPFLPRVEISPDLILLIFLPALLFEASWNLKLNQLQQNWAPIVALATVGVGFSVAAVGFILHYAISFSWSSALLFGAIISATDPVSVLALFRRLGAPRRLTIIVEGESLVNDGTAVVIFRIILGVVLGAVSANTIAGFAEGFFLQFLIAVVGGVTIGAVIGFLASVLTSYFDDHLLEITLTTIAAYGSFLLADIVKVSPVIAVLVCGLIIGNYGRRIGMSPNTQVAVDSFWEYAAFVVNSLVFLLIGLEMRFTVLADYLTVILWGLLAMTVVRGILIYCGFPLINLLVKRVTLEWQHILFWGGLRGALSLALALSIPFTVSDRQQIIAMTFGAVLFSLLAQGLTVEPLLNWLKLGTSRGGGE